MNDHKLTQKDLDDIFSEENIKKRELEEEILEKERLAFNERRERERRGQDILDKIEVNHAVHDTHGYIKEYITKLEERINKLEGHTCPCETRYL